MTKHNILAVAIAGFLAPAALATNTQTYGDILEGINMFSPEAEENSTNLHKAHSHMNRQFGTQWAVDMAYGYWHTNGAALNNHNHYTLLHAQLNQRLVADCINGGTWLRAEVSGSWGVDKRSAASDKQFTDGIGEFTGIHADIYGPHDLVIPELALMHYFNGKRACIIAGMVNLTNYFDSVGPANDSFHNFTNCGFVNSTVLGLPDANLGAVFQWEIDPNSYAMAAFSRETCSYGYNPFNAGSAYMLVAEYGRHIADGKGVLRLNPFFRRVEEADKNRHNAGLAAGIEYTVCNELTVFARTGFGAKQDLGAAFDFSCGATFHGIPGREDDFAGIAFGVFKGTNHAEEPTQNNREFVTELMYSFQVNDWLKIVPHVQYIVNPAYSTESDAFAVGVQAVFSF